MNNELSIRKAKKEDAMKLSEVKKEIWETTYRGIYSDEKINNYDYVKNKEKFQDIINNMDMNLYVVVDPTLKSYNNIIGYIEYGKPMRGFREYTYEIGLFYIKKEYQNNGLGRRLFNMAVEHMKKINIQRFYISCHKFNDNAKGFYEKMGGKVIHVDCDEENDGVPQIKYEYTINK